MTEAPTTVNGTGRPLSKPYRRTYVALCHAANVLMTVRDRYGLDSPEYRAADKALTKARAAFRRVVRREEQASVIHRVSVVPVPIIEGTAYRAECSCGHIGPMHAESRQAATDATAHEEAVKP